MHHPYHPSPVPRALGKLLSAGAIGAALAAAPAHADTITFEAVSNVVSATLAAGDSLYVGGDQFLDAGYTMTVRTGPLFESVGENGLSGAQIAGNDAYNCNVATCPSGNGSKYYAGLNDGALNLVRSDAQGFTISGLDFAFVAPVGGLSDASYGQLVLNGIAIGGTSHSISLDFPSQDGAGIFSFAHWNLGPGFGDTSFSSLTINACMFDATGACINSADSPTPFIAQFAIDNLNVSAVPEPSSYLMMLLGLAGLGLLARRRAQ